MNILVLIAGVLDPKWPVVTDGTTLPARTADRVVMSPFDEAALEIALTIRDADPTGTKIRAVVAGGSEADKLARGVVALGVTDTSCLPLEAIWDQAAVARALADVASDAGLILIGREFGDCDDGLVPAILAGLLGRPFFARAQAVTTESAVRLMRETGVEEEWLSIDTPVVASVTNDRRSRLRKPLMKNVMLARQAKIGLLPPAGRATPALQLANVGVRTASRRAVQCRIIDGSPFDQAQALAALLLEAQA